LKHGVAVEAIKEALAQPAQEPEHLTSLEKKYDNAGKFSNREFSNYAHLLMVKCFNEEYDKHLEKNNG
jgi:hypothetical protein